MNETPKDTTAVANALRAYVPLGVALSDQSAFLARLMGRERVVLKMPIGTIPIGGMHEHTELRARPEGFAIFRGTGRDRRVLLSVTVGNANEYRIVGGELKVYVESDNEEPQ